MGQFVLVERDVGKFEFTDDDHAGEHSHEPYEQPIEPAEFQPRPETEKYGYEDKQAMQSVHEHEAFSVQRRKQVDSRLLFVHTFMIHNENFTIRN